MAALLMATTVFVVPAAADVGGSRDASEDVRVVRVAFPEVEGISETDADGVRSGILYDWPRRFPSTPDGPMSSWTAMSKVS